MHEWQGFCGHYLTKLWGTTGDSFTSKECHRTGIHVRPTNVYSRVATTLACSFSMTAGDGTTLYMPYCRWATHPTIQFCPKYGWTGLCSWLNRETKIEFINRTLRCDARFVFPSSKTINLWWTLRTDGKFTSSLEGSCILYKIHW